MKAAPVNPKSPLQELKPMTSAKQWLGSKPIDAVASSMILLFNSSAFF